MNWTKQYEVLEFRTLAGLLIVLFLLASAGGAASAATEQIMLNSTWSEHDPVNLGAGVQTLSAESSSGFTSAHSGGVSDLGDRPRVYQEFTGVDTSQVGQKLTASFDVQFHNPLVLGDTQFRFGFGDTTTNQGLVPIMIDMGVNGDDLSFRMRYDESITADPDDVATDYVPGNYNSFLSASGTFGSRAGNPTNPTDDPNGNNDSALGVNTTTIHTFTTTVERMEVNEDLDFPPDGIGDQVHSGWYVTTTWTSDDPNAEILFADSSDTIHGFTVFDAETGQGLYPEDVFNRNGRIENVDTLGFLMFNNQPFDGGVGSFTISNLVVQYDDGALAADFDEDGFVDNTDLSIWETNYSLAGSATKMQGDADADMDVDGPDFLTWQGEFTGPAPPIAASSAVPEPSSLLLALNVALCGLVRGKRIA